jgi:hypothetical protein
VLAAAGSSLFHIFEQLESPLQMQAFICQYICTFISCMHMFIFQRRKKQKLIWVPRP